MKEAGETPTGISTELRALAALGRKQEIRGRLNALRALNPAHEYFRGAAYELRLHGHDAAADEIGTLATEWYRTELAKKPTPALRRLLGATLFDLGQLDEATTVLEAVAAADTSDFQALGWLGVIAARRNDRDEAERYVTRLGAITTPYIFGAHIGWQGRIAAQLRECDRAVGYFAAATRQGRPYNMYWEDALLDPIAQCAAFREFMKPED